MICFLLQVDDDARSEADSVVSAREYPVGVVRFKPWVGLDSRCTWRIIPFSKWFSNPHLGHLEGEEPQLGN